MGIRLERKMRTGWKATERERLGECMEVVFKDTGSGKEIFRYAPNLEDWKFWENTFVLLKEVDDRHKAILDTYQRVDPSWKLKGTCQRVKDCDTNN